MNSSDRRKMLFPVCLAIFLMVTSPGAAAGDDPEARQVMQMVEDRDDGDNQTSDMEMILIDKKGRERIRKIKSFGKDRGEDKFRVTGTEPALPATEPGIGG